MISFLLSQQGERHRAVLIAGFVASLMGIGLLWATSALELKWLVAVLVGTGVLLAAVASRRLEEFLLGIYFVMIPLNADFHWHPVEVPIGSQELGVSTLDIFLSLLYVLWTARLITERRSFKEIWPKGANLFLLIIGAGAMSTITARNPLFSFFGLVGFLRLFLAFLYMANHIKTRETLWFVVRCLMAGLILESLIGCAQYFKGDNLGLRALGERQLAKEVELGGSKVFRIGGTLGHPNFLGGYLTSVLPLALSLNLAPLRWKDRFLTATALGLGSVVLVLTYSRSAWLTTAFACIGLLSWLIFRGYIRVRWISVMIAGLSLGLVLTLFSPLIKARWTEDDRGSVQSRFAQKDMALSMIQAHPILGVGLNNYGAVMHLYETDVYDRTRTSGVARVHNIFLLVLAETGVLGLFFFLLFLVNTVKQGWKNLCLAEDELTRLILLGLFFSFLARLGHDAVHTGNLSANTLFWLYSALLIASGGKRATTT